MDPRALGVLIPIIAIVGFFSWMIARTLTKNAGGRSRLRPEADDEEREHLLGSVEQLQQRVTELEERLDFAERMLAQQREGAKLPPPS